MQVIINHQNVTPLLAGFDSVQVQGQLSDPVSKASMTIDDTGSQLALAVGQEVIICDETIPLTRISGTITPPSSFYDFFTSSTDLTNYTATYNPVSGSAATWTVASDTLTASGGSGALLLVNNWLGASVVLSVTLTQSDAGGMVFNVVDTQNYYELVISDGSSAAGSSISVARGLGSTLVLPLHGQVQLYKTRGGVRSSLGSPATIPFLRGTTHTVNVTSINGIITVYVDNTLRLTVTDPSPLGRGQVGLGNDTLGGHGTAVYLEFQAICDDLSYSTTADLSVPAHNYLNNNNFTYGSGGWTSSGNGLTFPSSPTFGSGAAVELSYSNTSGLGTSCYQNIGTAYTVVGQQYCFSAQLSITSAFVNAYFYMQMTFIDVAGAQISAVQQTYTSVQSGRVAVFGIAPAGTVTVQANFGGGITNATNSGTAFLTALQLEPVWFSAAPSANQTSGYTTAYPTPMCDFLQPDCATILDGTTVRFNRIFAGYIADLKSSYNGPNRLWVLDCTSLAGYLETDELINATYTNTLDQQIIFNAIGSTSHLIAQTPSSIHVNGPDFASANKVVVLPGQTIASTVYNDNSPREMFNDLQNYSNYIFGVDSYNNVFYQPQFYNKAPYGFSITPDFNTTFPMYAYELEIDGSQIRNCINVSGGTYQPSITESFHANDGTHSQYINGSSQMDSFQTTYQGVTIPTLVVNGSTLVVGGPGALYSQGYTALYNSSTYEMSLLNPAPSGQSVVCTYQYNALVYVQVVDIASIRTYGQRWYKINDTSLGTLAAAQTRGEAELAQYAQPRLVLRFKTQKMLTPGQVILVTNPYDGLSAAKFTVQTCTVTWLGNGVNVYDVQCGAYQPNLVDYVRNIHKAITRGQSNANAVIQSYVTTSEGESVTLADSVLIH